MRYRFADLTRQFARHSDYDKHAVCGLTDQEGRIIAALSVHRLGTGVATKHGLIQTAGGIRVIHPSYGSDSVAAVDVLRMPLAMSKKFAALGAPVGGAKTIVFGHNASEIVRPGPAREELWRALAHEVFARVPEYLAAEDVGTGPADMAYLALYAPPGRIAGCAQATNPSPRTAQGVVVGIEAALAWCAPEIGPPLELTQTSFAVQGLGSVGQAVLQILWNKGVRNILVADVNTERLNETLERFPSACAVMPEAIHRESADVFVPCALGGILNQTSVAQMGELLGPIVVAGSANNQLAKLEDGDLMHQIGIIYAPDFVINAGGAAEVLCEIGGGDLNAMIQGIGSTLDLIFSESATHDVPTARIAEQLVAERIAALAPAL